MDLTARVQGLDDVVDEWWEQWRGHPVLDRLYFAATNAGEFSLVWNAAGAARALAGRWSWGQAARFSALIGAESLLVNQGIKRLFRRTRPASASDNPTDHHLRQPITSSFPSGHSSAAFCAVAMLRSSSPAPVALRCVAAVVSTSRIHVRLHHASDVAGGIVTGMVLGRIFRRVLRGHS